MNSRNVPDQVSLISKKLFTDFDFALEFLAFVDSQDMNFQVIFS